MRLQADCGGCLEQSCLLACHLGLRSRQSLECRQCDFEEAPCVLACKRKAFFQPAEGILTIDREKCDGCGACLAACPEKAIELVQGKAAKCDLCAGNDFSLGCAKACPEGRVTLEREEGEAREAEKLLGWRVESLRGKERKRLRQGEGYAVLETVEGKRVYALECWPELSLPEARLVENVFQSFKSGEEKAGGESVRQCMQAFCRENNLELSEEQEAYLNDVLESLVQGFGFISKLLTDEEIEEVAVVGPGKPVYVFEKSFGWLETNARLESEKVVRDLANRMARPSGRRLSLHSPRLNAVLADGNRLHAVIPPVAFSGAGLTLRKFRQKAFTPGELVALKTFSAECLAFLWLALQTDASLLLAGNTGSGKTTSLNALFHFIPQNERIVVVEETPEIVLPHPHQVKLAECRESGTTLGELIVDSLRMRPDRVIVGEVRDEREVKAFVDTLLAGQGKGGYASFHALSAEEALARLKNLGVKEVDLKAVDLIVVQKRWTSIDLRKRVRRELRRVTEVCEVERQGAGLRRLYRFNYRKDRLEKANESARVKEKIFQAFGFGQKEFSVELERRKKLLEQGFKGETLEI